VPLICRPSAVHLPFICRYFLITWQGYFESKLPEAKIPSLEFSTQQPYHKKLNCQVKSVKNRLRQLLPPIHPISMIASPLNLRKFDQWTATGH
jgi:hypothetical protein